ncbi:hypothetical protein Pint_21450 [Pistacia integerrima]|uniref:Uncharacterized protein n=1 Tax=Pistacia integerrima TaxID=434235 RepID=A0ACC0XDC5_9ROSI|nr:hypothetical protein Pint_21450 [Pistacia integerrima]
MKKNFCGSRSGGTGRNLDCAFRATIGKRMTKLLGHEIEEDELFWIKDAPNNKNDIAVNKRTAYNERGWSVFGSASLKEAFKNLSQMKKEKMMQKKVKRKKEGEEKRMTQEEMLLEAAQTEIMNLRNLERVSVREEEVKKRAVVHKAVYSGPQIRYFSKDGYSYLEFSKDPEKAVCAVTRLPAKEDAYLSRMPGSIIRSWYQREGYIKSMADLIQKELEKFSNPEEMEECIYLIMQSLKNRGVGKDHTLAYQSRVGPVQWLKPYTDEVPVELGQRGVKSLLVIPVSFLSEHIETLEEIDMEYRELALESGIQNWRRIPALN